MKVLVPLDGSDLAAAILPDARRVAGADGELILIRDASIHEVLLVGFMEQRAAVEDARSYLETMAVSLREEGAQVRVVPVVVGDVAAAIDEGARILEVDMVACATHGRGPVGRLRWGGIAWRALVHSPVPVLLRHVEAGEEGDRGLDNGERRIMVPLDGSVLAERALPLVKRLAAQWHASIRLVQVAPRGRTLHSIADSKREAYLEEVARGFEGDVRIDVLTGSRTAESLAQFASDSGVTDIVMSSHGRSGLARVILGSVADSLIHRLHLPIVVVPALAGSSGATSEEQTEGASIPPDDSSTWTAMN